jgi:hypothetical protein
LEPIRSRDVAVPLPAAGEVWRPFAFCANARAGLIAQTLTLLAARRPQLRISAATSAVVHGMSVTFLLTRDPDPVEPAGGSLGSLVAADLAANDRLEVPIDGRRLDLRPDPAPQPPPGGPLLRIQVRTPDRPGSLVRLLSWLDGTIRAEGARLGISTGELDVWSALVRVVDGRTVMGRVTVRLPDDAGTQAGRRGGWSGVDWAVALRRRGLDDLRDMITLNDTSVVTIDLIRVEREAAARTD